MSQIYIKSISEGNFGAIIWLLNVNCNLIVRICVIVAVTSLVSYIQFIISNAVKLNPENKNHSNNRPAKKRQKTIYSSNSFSATAKHWNHKDKHKLRFDVRACVRAWAYFIQKESNKRGRVNEKERERKWIVLILLLALCSAFFPPPLWCTCMLSGCLAESIK